MCQLFVKRNIQGLKMQSVVECLPSMQVALGLISSTTTNKQMNKQKRRVFSSGLFYLLCLISYGVLIIDENLLDGVCALGIFVQRTGNEIITSFHINIM